MDALPELDGISAAITSFHALGGAILALLIVVGAFAIGHVVGIKAGAPLVRWWERRATVTNEALAARLCALIRHATALLLLLPAFSAGILDPMGGLIVAVAIGLAAGLLVYRLCRIGGLTSWVSAALACVMLVIATTGMLGGLEPLRAGLEGASFPIGSRRITLLMLVNGLIVTTLLFLATRLAIRILGEWIGRITRLDISQRVLFQKLAAVGAIVAAVLLGIDLLGIDLTALAVFSGALGLAVGFGLQKTFGNLIAGLILLMDRSIKPGDVIVVGDTFGWVSKIGVRAVSIITRDAKEHLIPNELLMTERVENWSYSSRNVRIHIPVGVSHNCDLALAQKLMIEAATAAARVLAEPKPSVWLRGFGDSSIDHDILVWISDPEQGVGSVQSDILNRVWHLFKEHGIEIPFPQRDLHIRTVPDNWPAGRYEQGKFPSEHSDE